MSRRPPLPVAVAAALVGLAVGIGVPLLVVSLAREVRSVPASFDAVASTRLPGSMAPVAAVERTVASYDGVGAWVDVFDFVPAYAGEVPPVTATIDEMAAAGVETVYLQAARLDDRTPDGIVDPWLLAEFVHRAHGAGIDVVGWYLPKWTEDQGDLARLLLVDGFAVLGHRFDGVAVDIEWNQDGLEPEERSRRLVQLSGDLRAHDPTAPLGAIVLSPVHIEVVNDQFWPGFPWAEIAEDYDVWLPMSYWSFRSESSGYRDGYTYNTEGVQRLRANIGDPDARVHSIGGIGGVDGVDDPEDPPEPLATFEEIADFARSLADTGSVGGSIYDWQTLEPSIRVEVGELLAAGAAPAP